MPTQINPDNPSATGAGRLQAMVGGRDPGTPSIAGKPGAQPGRYAYPAPPAPATAPPGRQPDGARAAMGGAATTSPTQPGTPAPAPGVAPTPAAPQPAAATPPPVPGTPKPAPGAGTVTAGVGAPAAPAAPPAPTVDATGMPIPTSPTIPNPGTVVPGSTVQTPFGTVTAAPDGTQRLALDAAGQQRYKESVAKLRSRFTVPRVMKGMQGLPEMKLKLGASNFDPFSGRFHGKD